MDKPIKLVMKGASLRERLLARAIRDPVSGCWLWKGARDRLGYGSVSIGPSKNEKAYRASYSVFVGPIPAGAHVLHRCDNPPCINPAHLFLGTQVTNMADKVSKGRHTRGENHGTAKLSDADVAAIRRRSKDGERSNDLARAFGVNPSTISRLVNGVRRVVHP